MRRNMVFTWADPHVRRMTMCEYACLAHRPMMTRMQGTGYIPSPSYADWKAWRNISLGAICQDISTQSALYASVSVLCASHLQCEPMPARISFPGHVSLFYSPQPSPRLGGSVALTGSCSWLSAAPKPLMAQAVVPTRATQHAANRPRRKCMHILRFDSTAPLWGSVPRCLPVFATTCVV